MEKDETTPDDRLLSRRGLGGTARAMTRVAIVRILLRLGLFAVVALILFAMGSYGP